MPLDRGQRQLLISLATLAKPETLGNHTQSGWFRCEPFSAVILKLEKELIENEVVFLKCLLCAKHNFKYLICINLLIFITTIRG